MSNELVYLQVQEERTEGFCRMDSMAVYLKEKTQIRLFSGKYFIFF